MRERLQLRIQYSIYYVSLEEFSDLTEKKFHFLYFAAAIIVLYPADSLIFKEGWKGEEMFVLVRGQ